MAAKLPLLAAAALALLGTGCANGYRAPLKPPSGGLFTAQTLPLTVDVPAQGLPMRGLRKTASESFYLFWPYPIFDLSWGEERALGKAVRQGTPAALTYAEAEILTVFGLFGRCTVNVYGP